MTTCISSTFQLSSDQSSPYTTSSITRSKERKSKLKTNAKIKNVKKKFVRSVKKKQLRRLKKHLRKLSKRAITVSSHLLNLNEEMRRQRV